MTDWLTDKRRNWQRREKEQITRVGGSSRWFEIPGPSPQSFTERANERERKKDSQIEGEENYQERRVHISLTYITHRN